MMSQKASQRDRDVVRINLEVAPHLRDQIKDLRERTDAVSLAEVFRKALMLYDMVITETEGGGKFVFVDANGEREVLRLLA